MAASKKASPLTLVDADTKPSKPKTPPKGLIAAAADGDRLELLVAVRARVAKAAAADDTPARDLAALTRRLLEVAKEIEILQAAAEQEAKDAAVEDAPFDASAI